MLGRLSEMNAAMDSEIPLTLTIPCDNANKAEALNAFLQLSLGKKLPGSNYQPSYNVPRKEFSVTISANKSLPLQEARLLLSGLRARTVKALKSARKISPQAVMMAFPDETARDQISAVVELLMVAHGLPTELILSENSSDRKNRYSFTIAEDACKIILADEEKAIGRTGR
jgi:hypothetical protein